MKEFFKYGKREKGNKNEETKVTNEKKNWKKRLAEETNIWASLDLV